MAQNRLRSDPLNVEMMEEEQLCRGKYVKLRRAYISFLHQKSRMIWCKEGDQNSATYHAFIRTRRRTNCLTSIINDVGVRISDMDGVHQVFI